MEQLTMANHEIDRLKVIQNIIDGRITWAIAANILALSERQIARLCAKVRARGNSGIIHGLRNRPSNHQLLPGVIDKAIRHVKDKYPDFGPTFANEQLRKRDKIYISTPTLRTAMIAAGLWRSKPSKPKHRKWREPRSCVGEMIQLDGSEHAWFERRGNKCVLLIYIDDASKQILHGRFTVSEDTHNLMTETKAYLLKNGRPVSFYVDKDSIYKINRHASIEEQLRDESPLSQFTRAMGELSIEMIHANSPQAKGRVERGFRTHQDRLVKEMRLEGISTIEEANKFLIESYIPDHNKNFAVAPRSRINVHRELLKHHRLDEILCLKTERTIFNDYTVRFQNSFFQLEADQSVIIRPKNKVSVEVRLDGSIHIKYKNAYLQYKCLKDRPYKPYYAGKKEKGDRIIKPPYKPAKNHPWRLPACV